ncbi:uncharacterized protein K02A2.6-like [Condylostylus longicornis]|uniref:uncharacterized protein K02A2.6-like n=1 Tax=Condylostylus longicornis TaxID=2530218 RepID=UPI00244DEFAB|nr:uncharacterized protein K02A2.6-like [Condylostylus longicornis]
MSGRRRRTLQRSDTTIDGNLGDVVGNYSRSYEHDNPKMNFNDKFIFCKRSLAGAAKLFIDCEAKPLRYNELKDALIKEFQSTITSAEVHAKLRERKKKNEESFREYLYCMVDIASQTNIDESSVVSYIIDGIKDLSGNKMILFGANTISELKEKLLVYEKISKSEISRHIADKKPNMKSKNDNNSYKKVARYCFNCGSNDHEFHNCPHKDKGPKCFGCNKYGHKKVDCKEPINKNYDTNKNSFSAKTSTNMTKTMKSNMCIQAKINNIDFECLIDTGSDICVLKQCYFKLINVNSNFRNSPIIINGLGTNISTKGSCYVTIDVNGDIYDNIEIHSVDDNYLQTDMIIGMNLLNKNVPVQQNCNNKLNDENLSCFLAKINIDSETKEYDDLRGLNNLQKDETNKDSPIRMKIVTTDEEPVYRPPRRFPPHEMKIIEQQIKQWTNEKIIRESSSDYASQIVLVKKKDNSYRLCVDYRGINKKIIKDRYPLPNIEEQIDKLQPYKYFTSLDLENGFFHVTIEENSRKYTSFVAHCGQFEFMKDGIIVVYIDDIIIPSQTVEEGINRLELVLTVCAENGLKIKWKKCQFLQSDIEYLGHRIHNGSISPSTLKTKAVMNFAIPTTIKQMQSFLGLANYFRKFIPNFAVRARPLSELLKQNIHFRIGDVEVAAFNDIKQALANKPVLKIFKYGAYTELHTDASQEGYGAVLFQKDVEDGSLHPVYYSSKKTTDAERKYSSYELEILAIVEALKKFRIYLLGQKFKLVTDCKAFECTMKKKDLATRVARWALLLEEFDYVIEHRAGAKMKHVDALSRNPVVMCIYQETGFLKKLAEAQLPDAMKTQIIKEVHERGHFHHKKMKDIIEKDFYISDLNQRITKFITNCVRYKGGAFTSNLFQDYCKERSITLHFITVGTPRGNGQIERAHSIVIATLTKLALDNAEKWYNYVKPVQQMINSTYQRAIKTTPFQLLTGCKMKVQNEFKIMEIIEQESIKLFEDKRHEQREQAKKDIQNIHADIQKPTSWNILYADDIALIEESKDELEKSLNQWNGRLKSNGLRINLSKTEYMNLPFHDNDAYGPQNTVYVER